MDLIWQPNNFLDFNSKGLQHFRKQVQSNGFSPNMKCKGFSLPLSKQVKANSEREIAAK